MEESHAHHLPGAGRTGSHHSLRPDRRPESLGAARGRYLQAAALQEFAGTGAQSHKAVIYQLRRLHEA